MVYSCLPSWRRRCSGALAQLLGAGAALEEVSLQDFAGSSEHLAALGPVAGTLKSLEFGCMEANVRFVNGLPACTDLTTAVAAAVLPAWNPVDADEPRTPDRTCCFAFAVSCSFDLTS
jgi:hypothetical protein